VTLHVCSRDSRDSRDSRGSRGSQDGLRMSSGPEMAGVGIFFQQEPNTGKVYVANIVPGGSADRSGVIRVNDVIVKVDDEDVQGQPLSTLRNLILGRQGSYVVLAFRRMTGTELYYFDAEILRGSPEYFESLKKTQAIADEKEKLITQVRQQVSLLCASLQISEATGPVPHFQCVSWFNSSEVAADCPRLRLPFWPTWHVQVGFLGPQRRGATAQTPLQQTRNQPRAGSNTPIVSKS